MKLKIMGSGGGEGYPALFCECEHCKAARKAGGKSLRSLSQVLIDDKLLMDLPAATHAHCLANGISLGHVEHLLITHTHTDHYVPTILDTRGGDYAHNMAAKQLHIYGNKEVQRKFEATFELFPIGKEIRESIVLHTVHAFEPFTAGEYTVTPLKACHAFEEDSLNYIIDDGKKVLLYLLDSGYPYDETLRFIADYGKKIDCVVMDATMGNGYYKGHMNFAENKKLKAYLTSKGMCDANTEFIVTHITHNHAGTHEEIEKIFAGSGIDVSFDGYEKNF